MRISSRYMVVAGRGVLLFGVGLFGATVGRAFIGAHPMEAQGGASVAAPTAPVRGSGPRSQMFARNLEPATQTAPDAAGPRQEPEGGPGSPAGTTAPGPASALSPEVLGLVAEQAPFEADRRELGQRYRMPQDEVAASEEPRELPPPPEFELLGVVSGAEGGLAVVRLEGGELRMLSTGDSVEGYTLSAVEADRAVMEGAGRTLQVPLATASPTVQREDPGDQRGNRRTRGRNNNGDDRDAASQFQSVQEQIIQRARDVMEQVGAQGGQLRLGSDGTIEVTRPSAIAPNWRPNGPLVVPFPQIRVPIDQPGGNR